MNNTKGTNMKKGKVEIFKDRKNEYRFRFTASNGKVVCQSEGYKKKSGAVKGIEAIQTILTYKNIIEL